LGHAVLRFGTTPGVRRRAGEGIDWLCGHCNTLLIEGAIDEDEFLDLLFRCPSCDGVLASRKRASGRPIARPLYFPPGEYNVLSEVTLQPTGIMIVGPQAIDGYKAEVGTRGGNGFDAISASELRDGAAFAVGLAGGRYEAIMEADRRGRASPTPPARRNRLIELVEYAGWAAKALEEGQPQETVVLDRSSLAELATVVELFKRWSKHPELPKLAETVASDTEFHHSLMLLAVASYLADAGNGTGLVGDTGESGRIPDLWTEPRLLERLEVEVKTPRNLRGPILESPLTQEDADAIVRRQIKSAASSSSGQLSPNFTGIVAIGGFHLGPGALDLLEAAAESELARQPDRKKHLAAVIICELRADLSPVNGQPGQTAFVPVLDHRLARIRR
jgi:hypothetical protein